MSWHQPAHGGVNCYCRVPAVFRRRSASPLRWLRRQLWRSRHHLPHPLQRRVGQRQYSAAHRGREQGRCHCARRTPGAPRELEQVGWLIRLPVDSPSVMRGGVSAQLLDAAVLAQAPGRLIVPKPPTGFCVWRRAGHSATYRPLGAWQHWRWSCTSPRHRQGGHRGGPAGARMRADPQLSGEHSRSPGRFGSSDVLVVRYGRWRHHLDSVPFPDEQDYRGKLHALVSSARRWSTLPGTCDGHGRVAGQNGARDCAGAILFFIAEPMGSGAYFCSHFDAA